MQNTEKNNVYFFFLQPRIIFSLDFYEGISEDQDFLVY